MSVDLLDAPLRISWDLRAGEEQLGTEQLRIIARRLLDAGLFFISLEAEPLRHPGIIPLLEELAGGGCQLSLQLTGVEAELAQLEKIPPTVKIYLDCAAFVAARKPDLSALRELVVRVRKTGRQPSLLWTPRRGQLPLLLEILDFCAAEAIGGFKLPNQKISANSGPEESRLLPDCNDLNQLAAAIETAGLAELPGLQLEVHDLFLWELLQPLSGGQRNGYSGCQAANSLGHIDAAGQLYPCSSWPEPLGCLLAADLHDLWQSQRRFEVRREIAAIPPGCEGCADYPICFGGCRGLSRFYRDDGLKRDLLCAERR